MMNITIRVGDTPRVYVERVDINGNTVTRDKVLRREFRVNEGDAFNAIKVKRSQDRLQSLGYFQENLEIKQTEGSGPDRIVLSADVEEKATGQLQFSGGYSSYEKFILSLSVQQNNFRGMGQTLGAGRRLVALFEIGPAELRRPAICSTSRSCSAGRSSGATTTASTSSTASATALTARSAPAAGCGSASRSTNSPTSAFAIRWSSTISRSTEGTYFTDPDGTGPLDAECDPLKAGSYLCDELGSRVTSTIGYSVIFDNTNGIRATRGQRLVAVAGLRRPRRRRPLPAKPGQRHQILGLRRRLGALGARRGRIHPPVRQVPRPSHRRGADHRPLLRPVAVASRLRHPRHRPADRAHAL